MQLYQVQNPRHLLFFAAHNCIFNQDDASYMQQTKNYKNVVSLFNLINNEELNQINLFFSYSAKPFKDVQNNSNWDQEIFFFLFKTV